MKILLQTRLDQAMVWSREATSHCLIQSWSGHPTLCGIPTPQWVNGKKKRTAKNRTSLSMNLMCSPSHFQSLAADLTSGCGSEKQCFLEPEGCSGSACEYAVTWTPNGDYVDFVVGTNVAALGDDVYIAVGVGPQPVMVSHPSWEDNFSGAPKPEYSPDSKVHGAKMGPIWARQDRGGPHVGPMNFGIWVLVKYVVIMAASLDHQQPWQGWF